ncbi:MAG: T9SS type A sorting domain-containing protein [Draconibacterium sp.]
MFLLLSLNLPFQAFSQNNPNEALWTENGWSLKKVVSNTSIPSGVNFSYTIIFSAPAGTSSISIQDLVPSTLQVVSVTSAGPVCTVTPVTNVAGNLVTYNLTGLPGSCAPMGSFTIVVKFPEGVTCNGETARNKAEIMVDGKWESTPYVSTTATAAIPWKVNKTIIAKASVNPNGGNCGYIMAPDDTITYRLSVLKDSPYFGNVTGQQNMSNAVVQDVLPAGAVFVSSTNPSCVSFSGGTITWNVNCPTQLLDAAIPWAYYWIDIKVKYPVGSFPVNTQILNQATLTGVSCTQQYSDTSNQTCITVTPANPSGQFGKYIQLANRVPGCTGVYTIVFCNNGNVPLSAFNIDDAIPSGVTVNSVSIWGANATTTMNLNVNSSPFATGINNYYTSGTLTGVNNLQFQMTGSLPVAGCIYMYVYFTVNPNPTGTVVTNCASFNGLANGLTLPQSCVSFTVDAGAPKPCVYKDICSPQSSYEPGDTIRYRIRVQNIGSAAMTGANIQDLLHSNFTYLGNEAYFVASTYNPGCSTGSTPPSGTTAWSGVTTSHAGNSLQWTLPSIASDCQLFYSTYCGYYGTYGLPYYYIEFDVVVDGLALPGVTPNLFQISGGNLTGTTTSNTVNVLITASFGQEVTKLESTDNGVNFTGSGTVSPGSTVKYRLNYKNTSNVPLSSISLIDLLPQDDAPNDWLIFNRSISRGSQFSVSYIGNHVTSLSPAGPAPTPVIQWAPGLNICLPPYVASGCFTTTWGATPTSNIRLNYGSYSLAPGKNLREDFDIGIPLTAQNGQTVCNDFAAIAAASFLLNGSPQSVALTPVASPPVCLNVAVTPLCCDSIIFERVSDANGLAGCCARIKTKCDVDSINIDVFGGTIGSVAWNCGPLPFGYSGQSNITFPANGCAIDMTTCFNLPQAGVAILTYTIYFSNGEKCTKVMDLICEATPPSCCDSIQVRTTQDPSGLDNCCTEIRSKCEVDSIHVSVVNGTISSASWNCGPIAAGYVGQNNWTFNAGGCAADLVTCFDAKQTGVVTVNYVIYLSNGEKCEKQIKLDCKAETCCDKTKVEKVIDADGTATCCINLITECEVKAVQVDVQNGTIASMSWNCVPVPTGYVGQSSYTFAPNGCVVNMTNCFDALQTGIVIVTYTITFQNGETCKKIIELDCEATSMNCCDSIEVRTVQNPTMNSCCTEVISKCEVDSVQVSVTNGTISSASWNCGVIPAGYAGQSTWTFNAGGCAADLVTCFDAKQTGVVTVNYVIYLSNGEKCEKQIELDCKAETCCDKTKVEKVIDAEGTATCCVNLITECEVKAVQVDVQNGTISSMSWNCITVPTGYVGQSSYTFAPGGCVVNMTNCFDAIQTGIVIVTYTITFQNGETCKKIIELDCEATSENCCDSIDVRQVPGNNGVAGCCTEIRSKCEVDSVQVSVTNGTISSASWNCGPIAAGYAGQSSWTFNAGGCAADLVTCFDAKQTGVVTVNYVIYLSNGEKCEKQIKFDCTNTAINEKGETDFEFLKLFPNPASGSFNITYLTESTRDIEIRLVNSAGQMVKVIKRDREQPGIHTVKVQADGLNAGVYQVVLYSKGEVIQKAAVLNK